MWTDKPRNILRNPKHPGPMYQSCHIFLALLVELAGVCVFQKFTILICFLKMQKQGHETHSPLLCVHTTSTPKKKHPTQWCCSHNFLQAGVGTFSDLVACTRQTHLKIQANTHQSQFWNHLQDLELILTDSENHSPPRKNPPKLHWCALVIVANFFSTPFRLPLWRWWLFFTCFTHSGFWAFFPNLNDSW